MASNHYSSTIRTEDARLFESEIARHSREAARSKTVSRSVRALVAAALVYGASVAAKGLDALMDANPPESAKASLKRWNPMFFAFVNEKTLNRHEKSGTMVML